jgi:hypothetical protein
VEQDSATAIPLPAAGIGRCSQQRDLLLEQLGQLIKAPVGFVP